MATKTITAPVTISTSNHNEGMAVSPLNCILNNRWLFFVKYTGGNLDVYRSSINSSGITLPSLVTTVSIPGNSSNGQGDIEISPQGDKIAIVNLTSASLNQDATILDLNLTTRGDQHATHRRHRRRRCRGAVRRCHRPFHHHRTHCRTPFARSRSRGMRTARPPTGSTSPAATGPGDNTHLWSNQLVSPFVTKPPKSMGWQHQTAEI